MPGRQALPGSDATISNTLASPDPLGGLAVGWVTPFWTAKRACPTSHIPHPFGCSWEKNANPGARCQPTSQASLTGESSPIVKFAVAPKYPTLSLEGRVYGDLTVRVTIDRAGSVKDAAVTNGYLMLREAAVGAAQQWKFQASSASKRVMVSRFSFVLLPEISAVISQTVFLPPTGIEIRQKPADPLVQGQEGESTLVEHPISTI